MGVSHTKLFGTLPMPGDVPYHDGEDVFYGYYLPYQGMIRTNSVSGTTDSAAGATALACGIKTINGYVGKDKNLQDVQSLTELAVSKGMATAVMSTDLMTGATPAGFSAHAKDRGDSKDILACQQDMMLKNGTIFECGLDITEDYQVYIADALEKLEESENGFFLMYEEGYIDKYSHRWNLEETYACMFRFNQAIGMFMEYAFYHPDTFLLITADHETGGLWFDKDGYPEYNHDGHTSADVPVFAYGQGAEVFQNYNEENNEIPKVIAKLWGVDNFGE
jgi:alkaline phosphatase